MLELTRSTNLCPSDHTALDDQLGLGAKVFGFPNDEIGEATDGDLSDQVGHAVTDSPGTSGRLASSVMRSDQPPSLAL